MLSLFYLTHFIFFCFISIFAVYLLTKIIELFNLNYPDSKELWLRCGQANQIWATQGPQNRGLTEHANGGKFSLVLSWKCFRKYSWAKCDTNMGPNNVNHMIWLSLENHRQMWTRPGPSFTQVYQPEDVNIWARYQPKSPRVFAFRIQMSYVDSYKSTYIYLH